jgi:hypothetical protein
MSEFLLKVQQVGQICLFELSGDEGQNLAFRVPYPRELQQPYMAWRSAYYAYFAKAEHRAKKGVSGSVSLMPEPQIDGRTRLKMAEQSLLELFGKWLLHPDLNAIVEMLRRVQGNGPLMLLVQCVDDLAAGVGVSLVKLPWEELPLLLGLLPSVQVVRTYQQRRGGVVKVKRPEGKLRILAIFGDDVGLDLSEEREGIRTVLRSVADVRFEGWNITESEPSLVQKRVREAIEDELGWDILFFAGHSGEAAGGELLLAPGYTALISEFRDSLRLACDRGLRFALFNSCEGTAIAERLIELGLGHVVVMREKITDGAARAFFKVFAESLVMEDTSRLGYLDVQMAAWRGRETLRDFGRDDSRFLSACLLPSVYSYPGVEPLRAKKWKWWKLLWVGLKPTMWERFLLAGLLVLSLRQDVQAYLMDWRQWAQYAYQVTIQQQERGAPSILLVTVNQPTPLSDVGVLADIIKQAGQMKIGVIGLDFILDQESMYSDRLKQQVIESQKNGLNVVFASYGKEFASDNILQRRQGRIDADIQVLVSPNRQDYPIFYSSPLVVNSESNNSQSTTSFANQLFCQSQSIRAKTCLKNALAVNQNLIFMPQIDYSAPVENVYVEMQSGFFLSPSARTSEQRKFLAQVRADPKKYVLIIAPNKSFDGFKVPRALQVSSSEILENSNKIPGGSIHAYQLYNLMRRRSIIPIPNLWMLLLTTLACKLILLTTRILSLNTSGTRFKIFLFLIPIIVCLSTLTLYHVSGILVPFFLAFLGWVGYFSPQFIRFSRLHMNHM